MSSPTVLPLGDDPVDELDLLLAASTTLSSPLSLDKMLHLLLCEMVRALHVTLGVILLRREPSAELVVRATYAVRDLGWQPPLGRVFPTAAFPILAQVMKSGKPCVFRQAEKTSEKLHSADVITLPAEYLQAFATAEIKSGALVPLTIAGRVLGVAVLGEMRSWEREAFSPSKVQMCQVLANLAALAVERAEVARLVSAQKRKLEIILQEIGDGVMVLDYDLRIQEVNRRAEILIGQPPSQIIGRLATEYFDTSSSTGKELVKALQERRRLASHAGLLLGHPQPKDVLVNFAPLGQGYVLSFTDVTHLKEVDRLKSRIVADVSHELRSPLASIKAYVEILLDELDEQDRELQRQFLEIIDEETDRLIALTSNVLDLARLEAGRLGVHIRAVELADVLGMVLNSLEIQAEKRNVHVHVDIPEDLPPVRGDWELMFTIFRNLISNAIKFSYNGGQVEVKAWTDGDWIKTVVRDQGVGIPAEAIPRLFEKFYRVEQTSANVPGSGLGLALVKEAVETLSGRVSVQSEEGKGAEFTVELPRFQEEESATSQG